MRLTERAVGIAGCAMLTLFVLALADREWARRTAFAAMTAPTTATASPDPRLWSAARLNEYAHSLLVPIEAPVATLQIRSVGIFVPVYSDTGELHLNRGAGLIAGMAVPGEGGNLGIAGHRDAYFRALKDLRLQDSIIVRSGGHRFVYRVKSIDIVPQSDTSLLDDTTDPTLTLVTCYPFYYVGRAPKRFVARAQLMGTFNDDGVRATTHVATISGPETNGR
jgi:LPXTG-site transpeptidase (sortase) family protein